jgi:SAM-dependent methyltransferase
MSLVQELQTILRCPDDGAVLRSITGALECLQCRRAYPVLADNVIELLPSRPALLEDGSSYLVDYAEQRARPFEWREESVAWGAPESFPSRWVERKYRQVAAVREMVAGCSGPRELFCDFSAGAGYYTLDFARDWRRVVHCDLSVESLTYAWRKARTQELRNILFVRMDYLQPAFRKSLECVTCMDSLIRGEMHERQLLEAIRKSLRPRSMAVVDFHNWWHNPVRRLGLLPNNFGANRSYRLRQVERLLASAGIQDYQCVPFHQEVRPGSRIAGMVKRVVPPTRWMYRFGA